MSASTLQNYSRTKRRKSGMGFWDRLTKSSLEPPFKQLPEYHIRVVKIKPGTEQYPLRVKLKTIDPRRTKYTALSYTWDSPDASSHGTSQDQARILCGGTPVAVKPNLYAALCQIRDSQSDVPIFVDALCINFEDHVERANMIALMGHVYSRAVSVIVWLGQKDAWGNDTVNLMRRFVNAIDWRRIGDPNVYNFKDPRFFTHIGMEPLTIQQWRNIHYFCHQSWFTRYWAFFELALAKQALFLYGDTVMDYEFLIDFGMILGLSGWLDGIGYVVDDKSINPGTGLTKMLGPVARLRTIPPWHPANKGHKDWMRENYGLESEMQQAWKLFDVLLESAEAFECRDARDRVYAPLAYIRTVYAGHPINKQWPRADYTQPSKVVLDHFRGLITRHTGTASVSAAAKRPVSTPRRRHHSRGSSSATCSHSRSQSKTNQPASSRSQSRGRAAAPRMPFSEKWI